MENYDRLLAESRALLTADERRRLSLALVSEDDVPDVSLEGAWLKEAELRFAEHDAGNTRSVPWAEARERIFAKP